MYLVLERKLLLLAYFCHCEAFFAEAISKVSSNKLRDCFAPSSLAMTGAFINFTGFRSNTIYSRNGLKCNRHLYYFSVKAY